MSKGLYKQDELSIKKLRKKRYYTLTELKNVCIITVKTTFQVNVGLEKFNPCLPFISNCGHFCTLLMMNIKNASSSFFCVMVQIYMNG